MKLSIKQISIRNILWQLILLVLFVGFQNWANADEFFEELEIQRGEFYFNLSGCANCHTQKKSEMLSGGVKLETPFGVFYSPNITKDQKTGIGLWSDQDFLNAMRHGVSPKGENYYPTFPYNSYSKMTDQDILAIKKYIFTLPAIEKKSKDHELSFPFTIRSLLTVWKHANLQPNYLWSEDHFLKLKGPFKEIKSQDLLWNRGAYLVEGPLHCAQCHTPRDATGTFLWDQWMMGSKISGGKKPAPNITHSDQSSVDNWSDSDWNTFLSEGVNPDGKAIGGEMGKIITKGTAILSDEDRAAVIHYLRSIKGKIK